MSIGAYWILGVYFGIIASYIYMWRREFYIYWAPDEENENE